MGKQRRKWPHFISSLECQSSHLGFLTISSTESLEVKPVFRLFINHRFERIFKKNCFKSLDSKLGQKFWQKFFFLQSCSKAALPFSFHNKLIKAFKTFSAFFRWRFKKVSWGKRISNRENRYWVEQKRFQG